MKPVMLSKFPPKNKKGLKIDAEHVMELPKVRLLKSNYKASFSIGISLIRVK